MKVSDLDEKLKALCAMIRRARKGREISWLLSFGWVRLDTIPSFGIVVSIRGVDCKDTEAMYEIESLIGAGPGALGFELLDASSTGVIYFLPGHDPELDLGN